MEYIIIIEGRPEGQPEGKKEGKTMWTTTTIRVNETKYTAYIKHFDDPSEFGIGGGRISKLQLKDEDGRTVVNYDRGWDIRPETIQQEAAVETILRGWN